MLKARNLDVNFVGSANSGQDGFPDKDHEGHNGFTTSDILSFIPDWAKSAKPDLVLLMVGTNDVWHRGSISDGAIRVPKIIDEIFKVNPSAVVLCALITPLSPKFPDAAKVVDYIAALKEQIENRQKLGQNIGIVDMFNALNPLTDLDDEAHPNEEGCKKMARTWMDALIRTVAL